MQSALRTTSADAVTDSARPFRGRRLSWREFYSLRPDLRLVNDNEPFELGKVSAYKISA